MTTSTKFLSVLLALSILTAFFYCQDRGGIVALNNYQHAVVICGNDSMLPDEATDIQDVAHMRMWNGNSYTINWGHLKDTEIKVLREYATNRCQQYQ